MLDSQDSIPVRDWMTLGIILLLFVAVIGLAVYFTGESSSSGSAQVVSGQLVTASTDSTPQTGGDQQNNSATDGGKVVTVQGQNNVNKFSFFQVFGLLLLGLAIFTVLLSVLITALIIVVSRMIHRNSKKSPPDLTPDKK
jgi:hypothetical protein